MGGNYNATRIKNTTVYMTIAAQSFTTIHKIAAMASNSSTTVPPMMPATYNLACCVSRCG